MTSKILITGGSGLVGTYLSERLIGLGYEVAHLSRHKGKSSRYHTFTWDISNNYVEEGAFENVDCIIHLAGAGIADKKWNDKRKRELTSSRVDSANLIYQKLRSSGSKVSAFISASAVGIYGFDTGGILQTEDRVQMGDDFLATLTKKWESAVDQFQKLDMRITKLRIGLVLSENGGLLSKLLPIAKLGLSSAFGTGEQFMSWIHLDDLVNMFIQTLENKAIQGVYNAVAPHPVTNKEFLKTLAEVIGKPYFLPNTPKFMLNMILGELSSALTGGNRVSSKKIEETGFRFEFERLDQALRDLIKK